jgi:hypothetical protein
VCTTTKKAAPRFAFRSVGYYGPQSEAFFVRGFFIDTNGCPISRILLREVGLSLSESLNAIPTNAHLPDRARWRALWRRLEAGRTPVIHSPACDIQPCLYPGKRAIMVEAVTVRRDRIRPVLGICPMRLSYKLFEIKILPASD